MRVMFGYLMIDLSKSMRGRANWFRDANHKFGDYFKVLQIISSSDLSDL